MIDQNKPLFHLTVGEWLELQSMISKPADCVNDVVAKKSQSPNHVMGISGIAAVLGVSEPTAQRIKASGVIDDAITQVKRVIITDVDKMFELLKENNRHRSWQKYAKNQNK